MKNLLNFLGFAVCMLLGVFTGTGDVQKYVKFAGVANEIAFCMIAFGMATIFMLCAILPDKKSEKNF